MVGWLLSARSYGEVCRRRSESVTGHLQVRRSCTFLLSMTASWTGRSLSGCLGSQLVK
uniref:Uncharacterized protein n=1 Tax=Rhizophora mucronata TaxID=61149 RepID=A0A2P2JDF0_RHIMU